MPIRVIEYWLAQWWSENVFFGHICRVTKLSKAFSFPILLYTNQTTRRFLRKTMQSKMMLQLLEYSWKTMFTPVLFPFCLVTLAIFLESSVAGSSLQSKTGSIWRQHNKILNLFCLVERSQRACTRICFGLFCLGHQDSSLENRRNRWGFSHNSLEPIVLSKYSKWILFLSDSFFVIMQMDSHFFSWERHNVAPIRPRSPPPPRRRSFKNTSSKRSGTEQVEDLLVFGYSSKLYRDDVRAFSVNNGHTLIPWMGDEQLMIDRYIPLCPCCLVQAHYQDHVVCWSQCVNFFPSFDLSIQWQANCWNDVQALLTLFDLDTILEPVY